MSVSSSAKKRKLNEREDTSEKRLKYAKYSVVERFSSSSAKKRKLNEREDTSEKRLKYAKYSVDERFSSKSSYSRAVCIGGNEKGSVSEVYNVLSKHAILTYPSLLLNVSYHGSAKAKDVVFCLGGKVKNGLCSNRVFKLNKNDFELKWIEVASMKTSRSSFGATVFQNNLIAAGGLQNHDSISVLNTVDMYEERQHKWISICPLSHPVFGNALVSCGGGLYNLGGGDNHQNFSSVQCLNDLSGSWRRVRSMQMDRKYFAVVSLDDCIYAIGGFSRINIEGTIPTEKDIPQKSVEKYIPEENKWVSVKAMNFDRAYHSACQLQGKIFVAGGRDSEKKGVREIDCYDPKSDTWTVVASTDLDWCGHSLVSM